MTDEGDIVVGAREPGSALRIEITSWDWNLTVAVSSDLNPVEYRFHGGLDYVRSFVLMGRVLAPDRDRGKAIRVWITPFGKDVGFGPNQMDEVGRLYLQPGPSIRAGFAATLLIPEDSIPTMATCLASVTRFLFIRTFDPDPEEESIERFSFSSTLPHGVAPWDRDEGL